LHFAQWQIVIVLRGKAVTSVEAQIGQTLQTAAGMMGHRIMSHMGCGGA
jgi:hypothetical protein